MAGANRTDEGTQPPEGKHLPTATAERPSTRNGEVPHPVSVVVVTQATHSDIPEICALYKRVWDDYKGKLPEELIKTWEPSTLEFTSWMEGVTYFAARKDGRVVGAIGCALEDGSVHLVHLVVDPEVRRQRIASALIAAAVDWAKRANAPEVWTDVLARFSAATALFRHLGFDQCGLLRKHQWNEDVQLFERIL